MTFLEHAPNDIINLIFSFTSTLGHFIEKYEISFERINNHIPTFRVFYIDDEDMYDAQWLAEGTVTLETLMNV